MAYRCPLINPYKGQCTREMYHVEQDHTFDPDMPWTQTLEDLNAAREYYAQQLRDHEQGLMADQRETAQWYTVNSGMPEIAAIVANVQKVYGGLPGWNRLPEDVRLALRVELARIRQHGEGR